MNTMCRLEDITASRTTDRAELAEQLARRREAALRLPPLDCGCHDPDDLAHLDDRCQYPQRVA